MALDFGGFDSRIDPDTYRFHIGTIYQAWIKLRGKRHEIKR